MKLFRWSSTAMAAYGSGHIIAMGETVEDARAAVRVAAPGVWRKQKQHIDDGEPHWLLALTDEDDISDWKEWLAKIDTDIAAEPKTDPVIYIRGPD